MTGLSNIYFENDLPLSIKIKYYCGNPGIFKFIGFYKSRKYTFTDRRTDISKTDTHTCIQLDPLETKILFQLQVQFNVLYKYTHYSLSPYVQCTAALTVIKLDWVGYSKLYDYVWQFSGTDVRIWQLNDVNAFAYDS